MKIDVYTQKGKKNGNANVADIVFASPWNAQLVKQVVVAMQANARTPVAHTKTRAEVRGGGKKPWAQKGTGRARHGSSRSPLWVGGGVTHGPRNDKIFTKKANKKMRAKALFSVLSQKLNDNAVLFVDSIVFDTPKTKDAKNVFSAFAGIKGYENLSTKKYNTALIVTAEKSTNTEKSFANFSNVEVQEARNINPVTVLKYKFIIITDPEMTSVVLENRFPNAKVETPKTTTAKKVVKKVKKVSSKEKTEKKVAKATKTTKVPKTAGVSNGSNEHDDLTKIEGIGPVIAKTLTEAGIATFAALADSKDEDTQEIIKDVRGNHEAGTWNEQAVLARDGKWEELKTLQDKLDGGK